MSNSRVPSDIVSISGFERAYFTTSDTVILIENSRIRYINLGDESPKLDYLAIGGRATALAVSSDFSVFAVSIDEGAANGSKIVVYSPEVAMTEEKGTYNAQNQTDELCISHGAEIVACLTILEERVALQTFDIKDGVNNCLGQILTDQAPAQSWQISFCPADEGVMCALGGMTAYLLRATGGVVENFSTIHINDALCHDWSNDVNIMFGTRNGTLCVYRETIQLEIVEVNKLSQEILNDTIDLSVVALRISTKRLACQIVSGIILVVDCEPEVGPIWTTCRAIIMSDFKLKPIHILSFNYGDESLLYDNGRHLMTVPIRHLTRLNTMTGDLITARHCDKIICLKSTIDWIISLDSSGFIIVSSKISKRALCTDTINGAFFFTIVEPTHQLIVATNKSIDKYYITLNGLVPVETLLVKNSRINFAIDSFDMKLIAVIDETETIVFRGDDHKILMKEQLTHIHNDINSLIISKDNKFLLILTKRDHVYCIDIGSDKVLWNVDYKLHFFGSIAYTRSMLLLLNQKFIVTRIKHGKDLSNVNMHASEIGFSINSEIIEGNEDYVFVSTDAGDLLCASSMTLDEPSVVQTVIRGLSITTLRAFPNELLIGYQNGSVGRLELKVAQDLPSFQQFDLILCKFEKVVNLRSIVRDIDNERNMIRETTEKFVRLYTENKDKELAEAKHKIETIAREYKERIKKIEDNYRQSEEMKAQTIANLKELYMDENHQQKMEYEKMIEDQIRKSFRLVEEKQKDIKNLELKQIRDREEMIESFRVTENQLNKQIKKLLTDIESHRRTISGLELEIVQFNEMKQKMTENLNQTIDKMRATHREDCALFEEEIWNLKATCVQLNEQSDRVNNEHSKTMGELRISKQQVAHLRDTNIKQENTIKKLTDTITELKSKDVETRKNQAKILQKLKFRETQAEDVLAQNHRLKRRMQDMEARIEQLAGCVYDARRLEHAVLNLIAMSQNVDLDERYKRPI